MRTNLIPFLVGFMIFCSGLSYAGDCSKFERIWIDGSSSSAPTQASPLHASSEGVTPQPVLLDEWTELKVGSSTQYLTIVNDTQEELFIARYYIDSFDTITNTISATDYSSDVSHDLSAHKVKEESDLSLSPCSFMVINADTKSFHQETSLGRRRIFGSTQKEDLKENISDVQLFYKTHPVISIGHGYNYHYLYLAKKGLDQKIEFNTEAFGVYNVSEKSIIIQNGLESGLSSENSVTVPPHGFGFLPLVVEKGRFYDTVEARFVATTNQLPSSIKYSQTQTPIYKSLFPLMIVNTSDDHKPLAEPVTSFLFNLKMKIEASMQGSPN